MADTKSTLWSRTPRPFPEMNKAFQDRFWSKVMKAGNDECWPWVAARNEKGYGRIRLHRKTWYAHRVSAMLSGIVHADELACHSCDNPPCCNPRHLFRGDVLLNTRDSVAKGRNARGESNGHSKLKEKDVLLMKEMRRQGVFYRIIGDAFGVSYASAHRCVNGVDWKHLA